MRIVNQIIGFLEANPLVALAIAGAILLMFAIKRPRTVLILVVLAAVLYLVFSIASVGTFQKKGMIKKTSGLRNITHLPSI
jgi:hypothetical protein